MNSSYLIKHKDIIAKIFTVILVVILVLSFVAFFANVNTTVQYGILWDSFAGIVTVVFLLSLLLSIIANKEKIKIKGGKVKKTLLLFAGVLGLSILPLFAVYSGIPIALHYMNSEPGEIEVTVLNKEDKYSRRKCQPRILIKEFTSITNNYICPGKKIYDNITIDTKINLKGNVSSYGIEPKQIEWIPRSIKWE